MKTVRIGGALGYWGDRADALFDLLTGGPLDYVSLDYLAEVTMSILQKQRLKEPKMGYAHDFVPLMKKAVPLLREKKVKLIANAGGLNPDECARAVLAVGVQAGCPDLKIGVISGDDLLDQIDPSESKIPGPALSANAYLGAFPIAEALGRGAEIVITGRVNDAALTLGPLIHEFGWKANQYDLLASGTIAGHLLECGGQASGGNFNGGWRKVPELERLAYPIAEVSANGSLILTIHPGGGGLVTPAVAKEQLLYEIGDPGAYIVADVICDLNGVEVTEAGKNRVLVRGVRGKAPTSTYKVSMTYEGPYKITMGLVYTWPDCVAKARAGADVFLKRLKARGLRYQKHLVSILGYDGVHGAMSRRNPDPDEVYLRLAFIVDDAETGEKIARELVTHIISGIPTACALDARGTPQKQVIYWPWVIEKSRVTPRVTLLEGSP